MLTLRSHVSVLEAERHDIAVVHGVIALSAERFLNGLPSSSEADERWSKLVTLVHASAQGELDS